MNPREEAQSCDNRMASRRPTCRRRRTSQTLAATAPRPSASFGSAAPRDARVVAFRTSDRHLHSTRPLHRAFTLARMSQRTLSFRSCGARERVAPFLTVDFFEPTTFRFRPLEEIAELVAEHRDEQTTTRKIRYLISGDTGRDTWARIAHVLALPARGEQRLEERVRREHLAETFAAQPVTRYGSVLELVRGLNRALAALGVAAAARTQELASVTNLDAPRSLAIVTLSSEGPGAVGQVVLHCEEERELLWLSRTVDCGASPSASSPRQAL